jgi:hypothetical protein
MASVLVLSATPRDDQSDYNLAPARAFEEAAAVDRFKMHMLTNDAERADIILFAEFHGAGLHFERIRRHPLVRRFREKCFVFCSNAFVIPFLPGIYASIEKRWSSRRTRSGFYVGLPANEFTTYTPPTNDLPYLFSFMGSIANARVRRDLATLTHARNFFQNTSEEFERLLQRRMDPRERRDYYRRYGELTKATKFVLCPRGLGASTIRLFETIRMGRVPVILSDAWVEPEGPRWREISIRIPERDFAQLPEVLEQREPEAVAMGELARAEWDEWFSDEVVFHRTVECCLSTRQQRRLPESIARLPAYLQYLRPFHFRQVVRRKLRQTQSLTPAPVPAAAVNKVA